MNAIQLYKFVNDNKIEYHWINNHSDVVLMVNNGFIEQWCKMLGVNILSDDGIDCKMRYGYFCFDMNDICIHFGISIDEIFKSDWDD